MIRIGFRFNMQLPNWSSVFGQTDRGKQCRPRSDCSWRSSLIRVYSVCHSICIFWTNCSVVKRYCSQFRMIAAIFRVTEYLRIFTVILTIFQENLTQPHCRVDAEHIGSYTYHLSKLIAWLSTLAKITLVTWIWAKHDKTNKVSVRSAKTQISLGIRPVLSESSLCA